jgi:hypothetical protein
VIGGTPHARDLGLYGHPVNQWANDSVMMSWVGERFGDADDVAWVSAQRIGDADDVARAGETMGDADDVARAGAGPAETPA